MKTRNNPVCVTVTEKQSVPPTQERGGLPVGDALTLYMREIGVVQLLSPEEELNLAKKIKKGDPEAREQMIKANLRLVVKIARDFENFGLPLLDLISEGNIGLIKAVERFNPQKGAKLSTYAAFWIKQCIKRALANQSKTIRLPIHVVSKLWHIHRAEIALRSEIGREPTVLELCEELNMPAKRIAAYRAASAVPTSLDAQIGPEDGCSFSEIIPDEKTLTPFRHLEEKTDSELVRELVAELEPREQAILRARFGLDGNEEKTLEQIAQTFGLSRERIRQVQELALTKLHRKMAQLDPGNKSGTKSEFPARGFTE